MAWAWGFFGAARQAFLGDGSDNNWTIWCNHFSSFVPILDFIHALSYVFAAAMAGPHVRGRLADLRAMDSLGLAGAKSTR